MSQTRLWASAAIITVIILITFAFSVPRTRDIAVEPLVVEAVEPPTVSVRDSFKKGVHTISGSLEAANACTLVSASATLVGSASTTESILVAILMPPDTGVCLQVPTRANFETTISASADLPLTVTVNGSPASTTAL